MSVLAKYPDELLRRMLGKLDEVEIGIWDDLLATAQAAAEVIDLAAENERRISEMEAELHRLSGSGAH